MNRRKNPPAPEAPPQSIHRSPSPLTVEEVMEELSGLPTIKGAEDRVRAFLTDKRTNHPEWWEAQTFSTLASLSQVFGILYQP